MSFQSLGPILPLPKVRKVMVVSPYPPLQNLLVHLLVGLGFEVITKNTPEDATHDSSHLHADLIILDTYRPEVINYFASNPWTRSTPSLVLAAAGDRLAVAQAGARVVLTKPFRAADLTRTVQDLFGMMPRKYSARPAAAL